MYNFIFYKYSVNSSPRFVRLIKDPQYSVRILFWMYAVKAQKGWILLKFFVNA